ncbi:radical SAM family heme chaperone HemW [Caloramator sp.]|uniref:radical SAM family heme chaperone HemW n=1 Tax=Caloramator sp. TaxID=1871330 RepID=UPI0025BE2E2E|nr:radical SAM family heme chaperone HemW [Caloramator sp.]
MKGLYIHIPFCKSKCYYCDFNSIVNTEYQDEYIEALIREINLLEEKNFDTIFIGGGTPTILSIKNLEKLLSSLEKFTPKEFTIEANPGTLNLEKLNMLKKYGVNRLSIGLQSTDNKVLKKLGRIHTYEQFLINFKDAKSLGFKNINVDLMFNLPDQNVKEFIETLLNVIKLEPQHISCYSLIIEENTKFYNLYQNDELNLLDEEEERLLYHKMTSLLKENGYNQYEISNFAKIGYECRHNIIYWSDDEYIGVGAGAHSYINGIRYSNVKDIKKYIYNIKNYGNAIEEKNILTKEEHMAEFMFLGLRMNCGININKFKSKFNEDVMQVYGNEILDLIDKGLIEKYGENIRLTEKGRDLSNLVFVSFLK